MHYSSNDTTCCEPMPVGGKPNDESVVSILHDISETEEKNITTIMDIFGCLFADATDPEIKRDVNSAFDELREINSRAHKIERAITELRRRFVG